MVFYHIFVYNNFHLYGSLLHISIFVIFFIVSSSLSFVICMCLLQFRSIIMQPTFKCTRTTLYKRIRVVYLIEMTKNGILHQQYNLSKWTFRKTTTHTGSYINIESTQDLDYRRNTELRKKICTNESRFPFCRLFNECI